MSNLSRTVLHYKDDKSDKVYVVDLNLINRKLNPYVVICTWGKREAARLSSQIRDEFNREDEAVKLVKSIIGKKLNGGYAKTTSSLKIPALNKINKDFVPILESNSLQQKEQGTLEIHVPTIRKIKV